MRQRCANCWTILQGVEPIGIDPHFRPQWLNILYPTRNSFIAKLEEPTVIQAFFDAHGVPWPVRFKPPRVYSTRFEDYYDDESAAMVRRIYANDFQCFGYSLDLALAHTPGDAPMSTDGAPTLSDHILAMRRQVMSLNTV